MIYKVIGLVVLIAAGFLAITAIEPTKTEHLLASLCGNRQLTPAEQFIKLVNDDFNNLQVSEKLPKQWGQISTIEVKMNSSLAKALIGPRSFEFNRVKNGDHFLEVEVIDLQDDNDPGIIIQASLFELKTSNKIFEIGRTYNMSDLNKNEKSQVSQ